MRRLLALGMALLGVTAGGLLLDVPATAGEAHIARVNLLVATMVLAAPLYFAAVRGVLRGTMPRGAIWAVLVIAALLRAMLLTAPPFLSSDIYRYVWDGRVQAADINPYRFVPTDPALAPLRDAAVYPHINRADYAQTIYPPVAELVFAAVGRVTNSVSGMRLAMLGFEALGIICLLLLLPRAGLPRERVLIYAWNPLPLWSFACDGHVDAIAVGLLGIALLLRARRRDGAAGAALAGAVLVKFFPLVVAPAFLRGGKLWRAAIAGAAVIVATYAIYLGAGAHVLGFLGAYGQEEGLVRGSGIWLLAGLGELMPLPRGAVAIYAVCVAALLLGLGLAIMRRRSTGNDVRALCRDTAALACVAMVAASPHYPWYFAWLALPAAVAPSRALLWLATMPLLLYLDPIAGDRFLWPALIYLPAALLLAADLRRGRTLAPSAGDIACPL
jgi:alpha-1,6-mannosyltransferase